MFGKKLEFYHSVAVNLKILVYGSKEFGAIIKNLIINTNNDFCGFIDDFDINGVDIIGDFSFVLKNYSPEEFSIAIAIGYQNLDARKRIYQKVKSANYDTPSLIHHSAFLDSTVRVGEGTFIMAGANIDVDSVIGNFVTIWPSVVISHNSEIGDNVFISPNATLCGFSLLKENIFVGAGATIVDHTIVESNTFIKANSLFKNNRM